jgi:hypothetical protein
MGFLPGAPFLSLYGRVVNKSSSECKRILKRYPSWRVSQFGQIHDHQDKCRAAAIKALCSILIPESGKQKQPAVNELLPVFSVLFYIVF